MTAVRFFEREEKSVSMSDRTIKAFKSGNFEDMKDAINYFYKYNLLPQLTKVRTENNDTVLHLAVLHGTPDIVRLLLDKLGEFAPLLCRLSNKQGLIALQLVDWRECIEVRRKMLNMLIPITHASKSKNLSDLLDPEAVIKSHPGAHSNPILARNLQMGCASVNRSRKPDFISGTHPFWNVETGEKKKEVDDKIKAMRNKTRGDLSNFSFADDQELFKFLQQRVKIYDEEGVSNCYELAEKVLFNLMVLMKGCTVQLEIVSLCKGDHVFNIIGRNPESLLEKPETWGPNAVIVDAWSGEVYPASRIQEKLMAFFNVTYDDKFKIVKLCSPDDFPKILYNSFNIIYHYNPYHHIIKQIKIVELKAAECHSVCSGISRSSPR